MPTTILVLGHIDKSKQNLEQKLKQNQKTKNTTFERMFGFDSKDCVFPYFLGFDMSQTKKQSFESKPNNISKVVFFLVSWFCSNSLWFLVCVLIHMIAICVLRLA